jgi:hypothetical protein
VVSFPSGTIGVTFRDTQHPLIVVSQTLQTSSIYVVDPAAPGTRGEATPVRHIVDRPIAGYTEYAMRPGTDEILELVTRYDRTVTLSLLTATSAREWKLEGPAVEGIVALAGTTPSAAYFIWPIQKTDPAALGVEGSAFLYSATYDATLETVAGLRNWGEFGPLGVSPDGRAVVIPIGERAQSDARFSIAICCERRPSPQLLGFGDRYVIGWIAER